MEERLYFAYGSNINLDQMAQRCPRAVPVGPDMKDEGGNPYDLVCGTFFVAGLGAEDFQSLSPELMKKYDDLYRREWVMPFPRDASPQKPQPER